MDDTNVIAPSNAALVVVYFWMAVVAGRLVGLLDQQYFTLERLYRHSAALFICGATAVAAILLYDRSALALWTGTAMYGLFNGPTIGYCYDLVNRITVPSETGMSVVMFGLNFGASVVPYLISVMWYYTGWPQSLIMIVMISHLVPYALMLNIKRIARTNTQEHFSVSDASSISSCHDDA